MTTETVLYAPTLRRPSSCYRGPVNRNFLMLCGLPQISSVHCRLTTACCCCRFTAVRRSKTGQHNAAWSPAFKRPRASNRWAGIPGHGCHDSRWESRLWWGGVTFALLWDKPSYCRIAAWCHILWLHLYYD